MAANLIKTGKPTRPNLISWLIEKSSMIRYVLNYAVLASGYMRRKALLIIITIIIYDSFDGAPGRLMAN